jgi:hypothetical protein
MKLISPVLGVSVAVLLSLFPSQVHAQAAGANPAPPDGPPAARDVVISITEQTYSLSVADADRLLQDLPTDAARHARLREMAAAGKAKLERLLVLRTKSGQRAVVEAIFELRYATEFDPPASPVPGPEAGKDKPAEAKPEAKPAPAESTVVTPTSFETRNVGDTLEVEAVYDPASNTLNLNLVPQMVRFAGERAMNGHPAVKQPIFETSKITTSVRVRDGQPYFIGTLNPYYGYVPQGQQPREPQVWLDFVTATVVRPEAPPEAKPKGAQNAIPVGGGR